MSKDAHLFEFVVPMLPPTWDDAAKVAEHTRTLRTSSGPTAVAVSTLDACQPAIPTGAPTTTSIGA